MALLLLTCAGLSYSQTASLTGLGTSFQANALSRNGLYVAGIDTSRNVAAFWTNGKVVDLPGANSGSTANGATSNGVIIVGQNNNLPVYWGTSASGGTLYSLSLLTGTTTGTATLISADGSTIAGYCDGKPVIWTAAGVSALPGTTTSTVLNSISDDGSTIACDLTGNYLLVKGTPYTVNQNPALFSVNNSGQAGNPSILTPYNPNQLASGFEDLFCLTADGSTQYGGSFDVYQETFQTGGGGPDTVVIDEETDGFWPVSHGSSGSSLIGAFTNFEVHSCTVDGAILAGYAVTPNVSDDGNGNQELYSFDPGNTEIAFGGNLLDLYQFLLAKGAASNVTLYNVPPQSMSADGSVLLATGNNGVSNEAYLVKINSAVTSLNPALTTFEGGKAQQTTVTLDYPAPANAKVTITSDFTSAIPSTTMTIPQGLMYGIFSLASNAVGKPTTVNLTATLGSSSTTTTVVLNPQPTPPISQFYPAAGTAVGGNTILGYVKLASAAGPIGDVVTLTSNKPGVQVPASVKVAAGATLASFSITSTAVSSGTTATLKATLGSSNLTTTLAIISPTVTLVRVAPSPIVGGVSTKVAVYLNGMAPTGNLAVSLVSNNSAAKVPATISVPAGATAANATVTTSAVSAATTVLVTAKVGSTTVQTTLVLNPATITGFYPSAGVVVGGNAATATVTLSAVTGTGGDVVQLASNTAGFTVPSSVTVPAGKSSVSFALTTTPVKVVTKVMLTATLGASVENTIVSVIPPTVSLVRVAPSPVVGGVSTKVAVYLNGKAPTGGLVVTVASNNAAAKVPTTITVPAGATAANATVTTSKVTASTTVVVTAKTGTTSTETTMVVDP
ncbi:MAG TPA: hypothetical protein VGL56_17185 [Fimbriimonadaceae bacterium]